MFKTAATKEILIPRKGPNAAQANFVALRSDVARRATQTFSKIHFTARNYRIAEPETAPREQQVNLLVVKSCHPTPSSTGGMFHKVRRISYHSERLISCTCDDVEGIVDMEVSISGKLGSQSL